MFHRKTLILVTMAILVVVSGCATGRNYQSDIDALNSRITALQGQLSAKEEEIARLQSQVSTQQLTLGQAEAEKKTLNDKLDSLMAQAEAKSREPKAAKSAAARETESDLK